MDYFKLQSGGGELAGGIGVLFLCCCFILIPGLYLMYSQTRVSPDDINNYRIYSGLLLALGGLGIFMLGIIILIMNQ